MGNRKGRTSPPIAVTPDGVNVLRALRTKFRLTQADVARRGDLHEASYVSAETGRNKLGLFETVEKVARGLYLTEAELRGLIRGQIGVESLASTVLGREPDLREHVARAAAGTGPVAPISPD